METERKQNGRKWTLWILVRSAGVAAGMILIAVLFVIGRWQSRTGRVYLKNLTLRSEGEGFDSVWLQDELQKQWAAGAGKEDGDSQERGDTFAAWTQCRKETVQASGGGGNSIVDITAVYGSTGCVFPVGADVTASDPNGCILGRRLAEELFGSGRVIGEKLVWRGQEWIVREIVEQPSELCILQASEMKDKPDFDRISVALSEGTDRRRAGEEFLLRHGLAGQLLRWDYLYELGWLEEMIPSSWSDFDSWKENFREHGRALRLVRTTERSAVEETGLTFQRRGRILMICGILLTAAGLVAIGRSHAKKGKAG